MDAFNAAEDSAVPWLKSVVRLPKQQHLLSVPLSEIAALPDDEVHFVVELDCEVPQREAYRALLLEAAQTVAPSRVGNLAHLHPPVQEDSAEDRRRAKRIDALIDEELAAFDVRNYDFAQMRERILRHLLRRRVLRGVPKSAVENRLKAARDASGAPARQLSPERAAAFGKTSLALLRAGSGRIATGDEAARMNDALLALVAGMPAAARETVRV